MNDKFIINVLSFALVLAVVASLFVWVILPALEEEGIVQGNNTIQELQDDVEEKVNSIISNQKDKTKTYIENHL